MLFRSLLLLASKTPAVSQTIQSVVAGALGLTMLASIAERCSGTHGEVVVHVVEPDVDVSVGGCTHRISGRRFEPILCVLPAGEHRLILEKAGLVLQDEPFTVDRGSQLVLTAWDPDGLTRGYAGDQATPKAGWAGFPPRPLRARAPRGGPAGGVVVDQSRSPPVTGSRRLAGLIDPSLDVPRTRVLVYRVNDSDSS